MQCTRTKWWALLLAAPLALAPRAQAQAPLERGVILGSMERAVTRPVERWDDMSLVVDISERRLYVLSGDSVVHQYPVAVGLDSHPTPRGDFRISRILWNPSWTPPPGAEWARGKKPEGPGSPGNPMGRVKMFIRAPDYYIHGTGLTSSLGNARSHGCIRMRNIDAVDLARLVMLHAGEDRGEEWYLEAIDQADRTREVNLRRPVPVKVRS